MWYNRLGFKLILFVGGILIVALGIFTFVSINSQKKQLIGEVLKGASRISETVKRSTRYDMLKYESEDVHKIIETIGEQEGIEKIRIFNKEGEIMFSTDKKDIGSMVDKKAEACYACHSAEKPLEKLPMPERSRIYKSKEGHRVLAMINPIYNEKDCYTADCHAHPSSQKVLGVLDIGMSLTDVDHQIEGNQKKTLAFAVVLFLGISVTIGIFVRRSVSRPVRALVDETKRIASGDLENALKIESKSEIGELANSFNRMTKDLAKAQEELKEWSKVLEKRVEERTQELKKTQEQLIQSEKLASLGKLAAGIAHEINNPLTGILTYSSLLLKENKDNLQIKEDLEVIVNETTRCRKIVKGLLEFARQTEPSKAPANINKVVEETLSLLETQALFQNIKIEKRLKKGLPDVMMDIDQIKQVFMNIIINAAEAMSQGGTLTIQSDSDPQKRFAEVCFIDTGPGIPEENLSKIFDPFFTTKRSGKGTGLGLSVSYGIIQRHDGFLEVKSQLGKGSTFTVKLPL
ncbi:MAG: ATP-binding protein [candidate division Zixibacteria bacterium]|nr:ATP-binding protein [candidate division Zixibacteria bacterium]